MSAVAVIRGRCVFLIVTAMAMAIGTTAAIVVVVVVVGIVMEFDVFLRIEGVAVLDIVLRACFGGITARGTQ